MIRRPPRSTLSSSSAASDVYKRQDITHLQDRQLQNAIAWLQQNDAVRIVFAATDSVKCRNWMRRRFADVNLSSKLFFMCLCVSGFTREVCPHHGTSFPKPEFGQLRQGTLETFAYDVLFISLEPVKVLVSWEATTVPELCRAVRGEGFLQESMQILYWGSR